ncbi:ectonucleoside triphosphate diphosphohydrolase 2-like [Aplochiton taeniatus]
MSLQYSRYIAPAVLFSLGIAGILLAVLPLNDVRLPPVHLYGVVLDAGSSHTAMYVYKWPADKQNDTGIVTQHSECHVKGGGISSYASQRGGVARSLEPCLEQALKDIPKSRHHLTPMYLGATAGMRLLNISMRSESDQILLEVRNKLRTYPFNFRGATILSGQEEGAYGWVTVNYLLENFIKYGFVGHWLSPGKGTVGALDFGGASTQITFETSNVVEDKNNVFELRLYGRDYRLYTQSFLCYGRDQVLRKILAHLITNQGSETNVFNPCYPAGFNLSLKLDSVFDSPCTEDKRPMPYKPQSSVMVQGTGHYEQCKGNLSKIFDFDRCSYSKCSFDGVFQPNVTGSFVGFSAFFYIHSFLQRATGIRATSPTLLIEGTRTLCNMSFAEMMAVAPDEKKRLQDYCAASVFVQVLMIEGYGFDEISFPRISFQKKAGDTSIGWALGYMLSLSSLLPGESIALRKALHPTAWAGILLIFVLLILSVPGYFLIITFKMKKGGESII